MPIVPVSRTGAPVPINPRPRQRTLASPVEANIPACETGPAAGEPRAYEVGFGKPPRHSQFKPGQSGNPRGRPKGAKGINTIVRETFLEKVAVRMPDGEKKVSRIAVVMRKLGDKAFSGDVRAQELAMKLYAGAVPECPEAEPAAADAPDEGDLAIIAAFQQLMTLGEPLGDAEGEQTSGDAGGEQ